MIEELQQEKKLISKELESFLEKLTYPQVNQALAHTLKKRLLMYSTKGKMLRGAFITCLVGMLKPEYKKQTYAISSATELLQSSLLIHDDIMDDDGTRRGMVAFHKQYAQDHNKDYGTKLGICAADVIFFMAMEQVATSSFPAQIIVNIQHEISKSLAVVGLGQMDDVHLETISQVKPEDILRMYTCKTAEYTFVLPFRIACHIAQREDLLEGFSSLGKCMGLLFQIKDDELGIYGDEKEIGKTVGTDIRHGKRTLFYYALQQKINKEEKEKVDTIFGNRDITLADIQYVQQLLKETGAYEDVKKRLDQLTNDAETLISSLSVEEDIKKHLKELLAYLLKRKS